MVDIRGRIDAEAMAVSTKRASAKYHQFASLLREMRQGGKHHLVWERHPNLYVPLIVSDLKAPASADLFDSLLLHLSPRLDREWNLFEEVPAEVHLVRVSEDHFIFGP